MSYNLMTMFLLPVPATGSSFLIMPLTPAGMVSPQYLKDSSRTEAVMYQVESYYTIMHIPSIDDTTHEAPENGPVETQNLLIPSKEYLKKIFRLSTHIGNGLSKDEEGQNGIPQVLGVECCIWFSIFNCDGCTVNVLPATLVYGHRW